MNKAKIILRFDDICDTIELDKWNKVKETLLNLNIKPILAVIPNNANEQFSLSNSMPDFWEQMRFLNSKGWTIALHGYDHVYLTNKSGMLGITPRSEFAGVDEKTQLKKITLGVKIFKENGITPNVWVAPAHSFDKTTLKILKANGFDVISDGLSNNGFKKNGFVWIPCQLWKFILPNRNGIFTLCIHLSKMSFDEVEQLCNDIETSKDVIVDLQYATSQIKGMGIFHRYVSALKSFKHKLKKQLKKAQWRKHI